MLNEEWRDIPGYEGLYQISSFGRVKSLSRLKRTRAWQVTRERILSPRRSGKDREYLAVMLYNAEHEKKQWRVHRLVAMVFIPNPNGYDEINHIDENKGNNHVDNLEWCSRSYNVNYGGRIEKQSKHLRKKVMMCDMRDNPIKEFNSMKEAGEYIGVHPSQISRASDNNNKKPQTCGYKWVRV